MNTILRFSITCILLLIAPVVPVWSQINDTVVNSYNFQSKNIGQNRYGLGLGRLLTSERERTKIDDLRFNSAEPTKAAKEELADESPKLLSIEGVTYRPDRPVGQRINIWISGRVYAENELPYGLSIVRNAKGEVTGLNSVVSKGSVVFAKIGTDIMRPQTPAEAQAAELAARQPSKPVGQQP